MSPASLLPIQRQRSSPRGICTTCELQNRKIVCFTGTSQKGTWVAPRWRRQYTWRRFVFGLSPLPLDLRLCCFVRPLWQAQPAVLAAPLVLACLGALLGPAPLGCGPARRLQGLRMGDRYDGGSRREEGASPRHGAGSGHPAAQSNANTIYVGQMRYGEQRPAGGRPLGRR